LRLYRTTNRATATNLDVSKAQCLDTQAVCPAATAGLQKRNRTSALLACPHLLYGPACLSEMISVKSPEANLIQYLRRMENKLLRASPTPA
jgi:hypothetical protein